MHWWDELPDLPDALVDWAQLWGTILSLLALVLALLALVKAKKDLADERHRQHELDILRDIGKGATVHHDGLFDWSRDLGALLLMIPALELPLTRAALNMSTTEQAQQQLDDKLDLLLSDDFLEKVLQGPLPRRTGSIEWLLRDMYKNNFWEDLAEYKAHCRTRVEIRLYAIAKPRDDGGSDFSSEVTNAVSTRVKA